MAGMTLDEAQKLAVERAIKEWESPHSRQFYAQTGLGWDDAKEYCGAFAATCWKDLHPKLRKHLFSSTDRLYLFGNYLTDANLWPHRTICAVPIRTYHQQHGGVRMFSTDGQVAQPGDVCIVRKVAKHHGGHITICVATSDAGVETISGNGLGIRHNGTTGGGVVKNLYKHEQILYVYRPCLVDLDPSVAYV
jgi:hypothetical protein